MAIRRDRIHYFASYEVEREPQTFSYTTPYPRFNGSLPVTRTELKGIGRVDFQFSRATRLSVRATRYDNRIPYEPALYRGRQTRTMASAIGTNPRSRQRCVADAGPGHARGERDQVGHTCSLETSTRIRTSEQPAGDDGGSGHRISCSGVHDWVQSHAITPQNIGEDLYLLRDDFTLTFNRGGRHTSEWGASTSTTSPSRPCATMHGVLDLQGGPIPANIEICSRTSTDVST